MKTFLFVYIATDDYIYSFDGFMKSLNQFCPKVNKVIKLLTNHMNFDISIYNYDNIKIEKYYIQHMPWPINTLFKFHYINNFIDEDYDLLWYCNANFRFNKIENLPNIFKTYNSDMFYFSYINKIGEFKYWQDTYDNLIYIQGGLFCAGKNGITNACKFIIEYINDKLYYDNYIDNKHDESALNYYHFILNERLINDNEKYFDIMTLQDIGYLDMNIHNSGNHNLEYDKINVLKI